MDRDLLYALTVLAALVPATVLGLRPGQLGGDGRSRLFWPAVAPAVLGPALWSWHQIAVGWHTGLATALWVTIAACMALFAGVSAISRSGWRLLPLLMPYLAVVACLATLAGRAPHPDWQGGVPGFWIDLHILVSVVTYALLTLGAVAALAGTLQERALKAKRPSVLTRTLPPLAESESLLFWLLTWCEIVLGLGVVSGMAVLYYEQGAILRRDHKTLLSIAAFFVIGALLILHAWTGVRGRAAARAVLLAYLLITLAYPGVKFIRYIIMSGATD